MFSKKSVTVLILVMPATYFLDKRRGAFPFDQRNSQDPASICCDFFVTHYVFNLIIPPFYKHIRLQSHDLIQWRILTKHHYEIDEKERRQMGNPVVNMIDRAIRPF